MDKKIARSEFTPDEAGQRRNDDARASETLSIAGIRATVRKHPMPPISDMELYLRLGVPDGLQTSGEWPYKLKEETNEPAPRTGSAIRGESDAWMQNDDK